MTAAYGTLDRLLHRLALGSRAVAEMSFDLDQRGVSAEAVARAREGRHVFVAGLARAGTTALMRRLYASGAFRSLTYRDMPFVLAPNLWRKVGGQRRKGTEAAERAHGDGIAVSTDSPESLDEVYWRVFDAEGYIRPDRLMPHAPSDETIAGFRRFVAAILAADDTPRERYLSKTNTSILRLPALAKAFPNARILIPYREPLAHAASLHRQHANFSGQQAEDRFVRDYMGWLVHHEFGGDHRPFHFGEADHPAMERAAPGSLDYWLAQWLGAYRHVQATAPESAIFVRYEALCEDPEVWAGLADRLDLAEDKADAAPFRLGRTPEDADADPNLLAEARALYAALPG